MNQDLVTGNRAEDFQPQTRNPQSVTPANLQPNGGLSQGGVQDILKDSSNAQILVPNATTGSPQTKAVTVTESGSINGLAWASILLGAVVVIAIALWVGRQSYERFTKS